MFLFIKMKTLIYPNNYTIYITDDTVTFNMFTSDSDSVRVAEFDSIDYVYKKLSEIVVRNGKAKFKFAIRTNENG